MRNKSRVSNHRHVVVIDYQSLDPTKETANSPQNVHDL